MYDHKKYDHKKYVRKKKSLGVCILAFVSSFLTLLSPPAAAQVDCEGNAYSFVLYSDDYMTGLFSGFETQILRKMYALDPNVRMIFTAGDVTPTQEARTAIDFNMAPLMTCGETEFPFFPAMGNHNYDDDNSLSWFVNTYGTNWQEAPETSRLATQLPAISNFRRGPLQVLTPTGTRNILNATIYSFDFKNAHFVILNNFEQAGAPQPDVNYGVWDVNGAAVNDITNSQLDWLRDDLARTTKPLKFIFSHVGSVAAWYAQNSSQTPNCPAWSEHQTYAQDDPESPFHTKELAAVLAQHTGVTIFRGHDHCPSRHLVDTNNHKVFERSYWDAYRDTQRPFGNPSVWQNLMGPGKYWQVDAGSAYNSVGFFTLTKVNTDTVTFETYRWDQSNGPLVLWDSFTVPVPGAAPDAEAPSVPTNLAGSSVTPDVINLTWTASTDNIGVTAYNVARDGALVGTVTSTAFSDIGLIPSTAYVYSVAAADFIGNTSASSVPVTVTTMDPDNVPPSVNITSPSEGATVSGTVNISANASDNVALLGVTFLLDGTPLGSEDTSAPFTASWNTRSAANGAHALIAVARDVGGNSTQSSPILVTSSNDLTPPTFLSVSATPGTNTAVINWVTDEPSNTRVAYGTTTAYGSQTALISALVTQHTATITGLRVGTLYNYQVRSTDAAGNAGLSANNTVIIPDTQVPTTPPSFAATVASPTRINLSWGASTDNVGIAGYRLFRDGVLVRSQTSRTFANTGLIPNTTYSYALEAFDAAGNASLRATVSATTQADTTAPTVSLTAPANKAVVAGANVTISANASDNVGVTGVRFFIDGIAVGVEDTQAPYVITWNSSAVANGAHSVTAVARDSSGNIRTSGSRSVTVRN